MTKEEQELVKKRRAIEESIEKMEAMGGEEEMVKHLKTRLAKLTKPDPNRRLKDCAEVTQGRLQASVQFNKQKQKIEQEQEELKKRLKDSLEVTEKEVEASRVAHEERVKQLRGYHKARE